MIPLRSALMSILMFAFVSATPAWSQTSVELKSENGVHQLLRNGKPYTVKGVGGSSHLDLLAKVGGNSIRTWSTDNLLKTLDEAHKHGLTVCVGMWLGHERHGFDYQNHDAVVAQLDMCLKAVRKYKDHPAVLMWGIGNEMEGDGNNPAVWYAVDHIAREIKKIDSNHPTMTVIAELGEYKLQNIERFCPNIDIVGVNSYGGVSTLVERYKKANISKPYIVTEHGPLGPWEVQKTRWKSPIESSSTEKAKRYANGYRKTVIEHRGTCLGSYAFLWGNKQETTATWFGMMLPDGTRLGAIDALSALWTGKSPQNHCPEILELKADKTDQLKPDQIISASVKTTGLENDSLKIRWVLRYDSGTVGVGGDFQAEEAMFKDAIQQTGKAAKVIVPKGGGAYRLFCYVTDHHGGAAVGNIPLYVDAPILPIPAPEAKLPLVVYADDLKNRPFEPSGYMGNTKAIKLTTDCGENPKSGKTCLKVEYNAADNWGGVLWQSPANDWTGEKPGGFNLSGASELEFWARGESGGEKMSFVLGVIEGDKPYRDSSKSELADVQLTTKWQKFRIPLDGRDLSRIKTGFGWSLAGQGKPVTFYLDDIRYIAGKK